ncbi:MAG: DNA polymerase III subunit delta [Gemmataceae bacterium]
MELFRFLELEQVPPAAVFVVHGADRYLRHLALDHLRTLLLGADAASGWDVYDGDEAQLAEVLRDLATLPLWASRKVVVVRQADAFVQRHRQALEKYLEHPHRSNVLVLEVETWKEQTRLARAVPAAATIACRSPGMDALPHWLRQRAQRLFQKQLAADAATLLVELVGTDCGALEQELAKLAAYVGDQPGIAAADVDRLVARSRVETIWRILELAGAGQVQQALDLLQHLWDRGEDAQAVFGAIAWQARKLGLAAWWLRRGLDWFQACARAGVPPFLASRAHKHVLALGPRALHIARWLLETDFSMKGGSGLSPRLAVERLLVLLSPQA